MVLKLFHDLVLDSNIDFFYSYRYLIRAMLKAKQEEFNKISLKKNGPFILGIIWIEY